MTAGIQIFNNSNTIVIDSESINFVLYSKGSITTQTPPADQRLFPGGTGLDALRYISYYSTSIGVINLYGAPDGGVFAVQCQSNVAPVNFSYPMTTASGAFLTVACEGSVGTTVNWWYFVPVNRLGPSSGGAGLRVFTQSGQIAYDSGYKPIQYVDSKSGPGSPGNNATGGPFTYTSGRSYALILSSGGGYMGGKKRSTTIYDYVHIGVGGSVNGNVVYTKDVIGMSEGYNLYSGVPYNPLYLSWSVIVVDVTNL